VILHRARWVLPIASPPLHNGWVLTHDGLILDAGNSPRPLTRVAGAAAGTPHSPGSPGEGGPLETIDHGDVVILPGLINVHTHLELSWMAGLVPASDTMGGWIRALMALRRNAPPPEQAQRAAAVTALAAARAAGTAAFGDIGNTLITADVLSEAGVPGVLFHELLGFAPGDAQGRAEEGARRVTQAVRPPLKAGLAPHAPYSVSPALFRAIGDVVARTGLPSSVHLGESREELEFLMTGGGDIAETLKHLGAWNDAWSPPRCGPAEYLDRLGVLRPGLLVVHAAQLLPDALHLVAERGCVIVSCPRSNRWVGAGDPPLDAFYASGAPVTFGTDSLASAPNLEMFAELAAARAVSSVPAARLLESATRIGAEALGLDADLGTLEPGKRADLLAVRLPAGVVDVEEYMVGGIEPDAIEWLENPPQVETSR
jgi:cytosine/adenosine deaminase-related metal-dependent hydrolase